MKQQILDAFEQTEDGDCFSSGFTQPNTADAVHTFLADRKGIVLDIEDILVEEGTLELSDNGTPRRCDTVSIESAGVTIFVEAWHALAWDFYYCGEASPEEEAGTHASGNED